MDTEQLTLIGPFAEMITLSGLPIKGKLSDDQLQVVKEGGILVRHGRVVAVGVFESLRGQATRVERIDFPAVAMPSMVDCHTHLVWAGSRAGDYALRNGGSSYQEILAKGGGISDTVSKTQAASKDELVTLTRQRIERHLSDGITTIEIKSGYGLMPEQEIKILEVVQELKSIVKADLVPTCLAAHVCPKGILVKDFLAQITDELFPVLKKKNLSHRIDIFVEDKAFPVSEAKGYLEKAKEFGFALTVHADQFTTGGSVLAVALGAMSADHLEESTDTEIGLLAQSDTVAVALPGASLGLGMKFTPARKLLDAGACLAIATDWNPGSAPMGDLMTEAAILGTYEKLSSAEIFAGLTFRSAKALGLTDRGCLQAGMLADFMAFSTSDYREILYQQGKMKPIKVWKNGVLI